MDNLLIIIGLIILGIIMFIFIGKDKSKRYTYIDEYQLPNSINNVLKNVYSHLTDEDIEIIKQGLKEYLKLYVLSNNRGRIILPSQVIDIAWHEFTKTVEYQEFCIKAFRFYLNRSLVNEMLDKRFLDNDLKVVWTLACKKEDINPIEPHKLPLIFSIDTKLKIDDGYKYTIDDREDDLYFNVKNIGCMSELSVYGGRGL